MAKTDTQAVVPAETGGELAEVHYLHRGQQAAEDGADVADTASSTTAAPAGEDEALDAEIISEEEYQRLKTQRGQALERYRGYRQDLVTAGRATRTAAAKTREHAGPPTARVGKFATRHSYYVVAGSWDMVCDSYKHLSGRDIDEEIYAARQAGDHGTVTHLLSKKQEQTKIRLEYVKTLGKGVLYTPAVAGGTVVATLAVTLIVSIAAFVRPGGMSFTDVWSALAEAVEAGWQWVLFAGGLVPWAAAVALAGIVVTGYNKRRRGGDAPAWSRSSRDDGDARDLIPDESAILTALNNLGIAKLDDAFKRGWGSKDSPTKVFEEGTVRDGQGYRTQIRLPQAVDVDTINARKKLLAHNLVRFPVEVWPTEPKDKPGVMDLWVADQGVLTGSVGPWPWMAELESTQADYFTGVPVGKDIRGDVIWANLFEANFAIAGIMGSGKSTLALEIAAGASLDPLVDLDVFVLAENADFEPLGKRLSTLLTGPGDEIVEAAADKLQQLWDELEVRGQALKEHGVRKNSRTLAEKDARLRPKVLVIDECQNLFLNKKLGEQAAVLSKKLINTARKYGITVLFLTPEASTASLPRQVMSVISNKACFAIGDQQSNDAVLGTGSYKAGISATTLEPKTSEGPGDVGTAMTRGFKAKPSLLRTFYINEDELGRIADRAMDLLNGTAPRAVGTGQASSPADDRDLLTDLDQALGADRANAADVPALLRDLDGQAKRYYAELTGKELVERLRDEHGLKCPNVSRKYKIIPDSVRGKLAEQRAADSADDEPLDDE